MTQSRPRAALHPFIPPLLLSLSLMTKIKAWNDMPMLKTGHQLARDTLHYLPPVLSAPRLSTLRATVAEDQKEPCLHACFWIQKENVVRLYVL